MDYPRTEIVERAEAAIRRHGGPARARVFFTFTCEACGERCTFDEPNHLYEHGECHACGHVMAVARAGFSLVLSAASSRQAAG